MQTTESVNITVWHCADATIADTLQKQVDALAPEIVVTFERKENMSDALKLVSDDPESAPDMFMWAHDKVGTFAQMGILSPITDVLTEDDLADFLPMTLSAGEYQGDKYQLPLYYEALLFLYNKDLMETAPETTDELLELMKNETTADQYVFVEQHSTSYNAAAWIQGFGGYLINENREPGLNLPQTVEAMEYHKQFVSYMPADGEYNTVTTLFTEGKVASTIGGPWLVPGIKEAGIDLGIAPMPVLPNGTSLTPFSGVQGVHRKNCRDFFALRKISAEEFHDRIVKMLLRYRTGTLRGQLNLLDSHDVNRFLSYCEGDLRRFRLAEVFLFTSPGIPCVFYGDELGMDGSSETTLRGPMPWEKVQDGEDDFFSRLIAIRKEHEELTYGDYTLQYMDHDGGYIYQRTWGDHKITVCLNNGSTTIDLREYLGKGSVLLSESYEAGKLGSMGYAIIEEK